MIEINQDPNDNLISAQVSNKLTGDDYKKLNPLINEKLEEFDKVNMLFDFVNFDDITFSSMWQELKFDSKHSDDIDRIAIIGDFDSEEGLESLKDTMSSAQTKYFEPQERNEAQQWVSSGTVI